MVWVEESLRGQGYGTELMRAAERKALERGCHHARLETFALESFEFYEKLGYEVFGELEGHPPGSTTYFMKKADLKEWGDAPKSVTTEVS
jgi:ribosomal protein S18 acetylase RimI-like enzyme